MILPEAGRSAAGPSVGTLRMLADKPMVRVLVLQSLLIGTGLSTCAQQPFFTDDADVTAKRRFHLELSNQFSFLQKAAFPNQRQNALVYQLNYGLREGVEVSIDSPYLIIVNAPGTLDPRVPVGAGDTNLAVKWNFRKEQVDSSWPAMTITYAVEMPTGDGSTQLGSGLYDYRLIAIAQKTRSPVIKLRINQGMLFSGNTLTGVVGLRAQGFVYLAAISLVREFSPRPLLGVEFSGAVDPNSDESRGAMQEQVGGKYYLRKELTIDFGLVLGQFGESPPVALQIGLSLNF